MDMQHAPVHVHTCTRTIHGCTRKRKCTDIYTILSHINIYKYIYTVYIFKFRFVSFCRIFGRNLAITKRNMALAKQNFGEITQNFVS
jgi:hypothetical protein